MLKKFSAALLIVFFLASGVAQAYDLPKLKPDKVIKASKEKKPPMLKGDWQGADIFEQAMKYRLESGELEPNDPARVPVDKNYVFVAFYNGAPYFLDKYSIQIKKNSDTAQIWEQKIFPITKKFSPRNATSTNQRFCLVDGKSYNSNKPKNAIAEVADEKDKLFLEECFKVGYYFAFGEGAAVN